MKQEKNRLSQIRTNPVPAAPQGPQMRQVPQGPVNPLMRQGPGSPQGPVGPQAPQIQAGPQIPVNPRVPAAPQGPVGPQMPPAANSPVNPALSGNPILSPQVPFLKRIDGDAVIHANETLQKYKAGKANLEKRIVSSENWWKMRNWREIDGGNPDDKKPVTAWLFNVIMGKHADAIEAYPEPNILPREAGDKEEAKVLSSILPCVLEQNGFEQTYSDCAWQKMKTGTGIYGVFWDQTKLNGLGDISIRKADALNLFWKPGITDIETSPNLFSVDIVDNDELEAKYPVLQGKLRGNSMTVAKYVYRSTRHPASIHRNNSRSPKDAFC